MAICLESGAGYALKPMVPQPATVAGCTYVVMSGTEYMSNPWNWSVEDGQSIAWAVVSVWLVGAAWRLLIRAARDISAGGESDA
jgi:hypothetical protein